MDLVKLRVDSQTALKVFAKGVPFEDKFYKIVKENGMNVLQCPEELAIRLLSKSENTYSLLSPAELTVIRRTIRGNSVVTIKSVSTEKVEGTGPEDDALALIASISSKYEKLEWEKSTFVEFLGQNNIEVKGNWGIPKMIKELVRFDSELVVTLEEYIK